jgi:hypothetical protein
LFGNFTHILCSRMTIHDMPYEPIHIWHSGHYSGQGRFVDYLVDENVGTLGEFNESLAGGCIPGKYGQPCPSYSDGLGVHPNYPEAE